MNEITFRFGFGFSSIPMNNKETTAGGRQREQKSWSGRRGESKDLQ